MIGKIARIKEAANANVGAFLRALYDYDIPKVGDLWKMGNTSGGGGQSLTVWENGNWMDHATGEKGDLIDLAKAYWGCTKATLYTRLEEMLGINNDFSRPHPVDRRDDSLETVEVDEQMEALSFKAQEFLAQAEKPAPAPVAPIVHSPSGGGFVASTIASQPQAKAGRVRTPEEHPQWQPCPDFSPWSPEGGLRGPSKEPSFSWPFHNREGVIQFWVARFDLPGGGKSFSIAYYSKEGWIQKKPRLESFPLLGIHDFWRLKDSDTKTIVVLVEGEKAATIGNRLAIPGFWFTTWHGGAANTKKIDLSPLFGRKVLLWPDNDQPGKTAMQGIYGVLHGHAFAHLLALPTDWALKDDIVDVYDRFGLEYVTAFLIGGCKNLPTDMNVGDIPDEHREPNQLGSIYRLVDRYGKDLKFSQEKQQWYVWDDGWWQEDRGGKKVFGYVTDTVLRAWEDCLSNDPKEIEQYSKKAKNVTHMMGIIQGAALQHEVNVSENDFDPDPDHIAVANGYLDLRTGELSELRREHMVSKIIPFRFDPKATCPRFEEFVLEIMCGNHRLVTFLQDYFGYALTGLPPDRIFAILHGSGKNGKSTLINIIGTIMGDYHVAARVESVMASDRPDKIGEDLIPLRGARLASLQESERGMRINESKVKGLTGRDRMRCRPLHSNTWLEWVNTAKMVLSTNYRPKITGNDKGIWDRITLVPFDYRVKVDETDLHLKIITQEGSGVLNWLVKGAMRYYANGKKIIKPKEISDSTRSYHEDENTIGTFVDTCLSFREGDRMQASQVYLLYKRWMEQQEDQAILGLRNFQEEIGHYFEDLQVKRVRSSAGIFYHGVSKRTDWDHTKTSEDKIEDEIVGPVY